MAGQLTDSDLTTIPMNAGLSRREQNLTALPAAFERFNGFYARYPNFILTNTIHNILSLVFIVLLVLSVAAFSIDCGDGGVAAAVIDGHEPPTPDRFRGTSQTVSVSVSNPSPANFRFSIDSRGVEWQNPIAATASSFSRHTFTKFEPRKDHRGVDLVSDALPVGRLWYGEPKAARNAVGYAKFRSRSHRSCDPRLR